MADILKSLLEERSRLNQQLATVDAAIKVFGGSVNSRKGTKRGKRKMSKAARAKIAAAQRKRWEKVRKESKAS